MAVEVGARRAGIRRIQLDISVLACFQRVDGVRSATVAARQLEANMAQN